MARLELDGVPANLLARRWSVPECDVFRSLSSTLDAIHDRGARGARTGAVVIAEEQTAGRGREGRTWRSPVGGVWLALLLRPPVPAAGALSLRIGLVLADVVDELLAAPRARLKWPNDVLVDDRKLAGILCESRWQRAAPEWLGVGIGINVANEIPAELRHTAVALTELRPDVRRIDVLDRLVPALVRCGTPSAGLTEQELAAFAARDWLRGRQLAQPALGRAAGLAPDGALLVAAATGTVRVREGSVRLA